MTVKKKVVYLKGASHFWPPNSKISFSLEERFFGFGRMGGLGGWVRQIPPAPRAPPRPRMDKHIPGPDWGWAAMS